MKSKTNGILNRASRILLSAADKVDRCGQKKRWCIEPGEDPDTGKPTWQLQDAPGERGGVYAVFYDRELATAVLNGLKTIGFAPR